MEKEEIINWNMNKAYLMGLDSNFRRCNEAAGEDDILKWRNYLKAILRMIKVKLTDDEVTTIKTLFTKVDSGFFNIIKSTLSNKSQAAEQIRSVLDEIESKMYEFSFKYKLIELGNEKRSIEEAIDEDYQ